MKRRVVAAVMAMLLAVVGGVLLLAYVSGADRRAMADLTPVSVLVVTKAVPEGATAGEITDSVEVRQLPRVAVAPDATSSLGELGNLVTTTALQPGEQVLRSRLADPAVLEAGKGLVVPPGMHEVSIALQPQRAVAGQLTPGDTVGVFLSVVDKEASYTQLKLHKVLVTAVAGGPAPAAEDGSAEAKPAQETMTVTLAALAADVAKIVFTAEHGTIYLSAEPADASDGSLPVLTKGNVYK